MKRALSAPRLNMGAEAPKKPPVPSHMPKEMEGKDPFAIAQMLYSRMLDEVLTKTEDVGARFPEEARKIHYGETEQKLIRGQVSAEETRELLEEGIPVLPLPVPKALKGPLQ